MDNNKTLGQLVYERFQDINISPWENQSQAEQKIWNNISKWTKQYLENVWNNIPLVTNEKPISSGIHNMSNYELDILIAEHVMGYTDIKYVSIPHYSTELDLAWKVLERMKEGNLASLFTEPRYKKQQESFLLSDDIFMITDQEPSTREGWYVRYKYPLRPTRGTSSYVVLADTAPLAICRAAVCCVSLLG